MILYHFARADLLVEISVTGLNPNSGYAGFCRDTSGYIKEWGMQPIFLTSDPQFVIDTMLGQHVKNYVLLKVDCDGLPVEPEKWWSPLVPGVEPEWNGITYICKQRIDPDRLSLAIE